MWKYTNWIFVWNSEFFFVPHSWRAVYFIVIVLFFLLQEFSQVNFQNLLKLSCTKIKIAKLFLYSISQGNTDLASVLGHGHFECFKLCVLVFAKFLCAVFISPFPPHSHCLFYCPLIANQFSLNFFFIVFEWTFICDPINCISLRIRRRILHHELTGKCSLCDQIVF